MNQIIIIAQIIISIILIVLILLQQRGTGLSGILGGGDSGFYQQRRGLEKTIFYATIILAAIFLILNILALFNI